MKVFLKVVGGKQDGREIAITTPEFKIGRSKDAQLTMSSELVSREHCKIVLGDGRVLLKDLGSRNGTYVNDRPISEPHICKVGDVLRVGKLAFEILIDHSQGGIKKPKVSSLGDAVHRSANKKPSIGKNLDDSVSNWLSDDFDAFSDSEDTVQFRLDDVRKAIDEREKQAESEKEEAAKATQDEHDDQDSSANEKKSGSGFFRRQKRDAKKLPRKPKIASENSTSAADDVLKKFFRRR